MNLSNIMGKYLIICPQKLKKSSEDKLKFCEMLLTTLAHIYMTSYEDFQFKT